MHSNSFFSFYYAIIWKSLYLVLHFIYICINRAPNNYIFTLDIEVDKLLELPDLRTPYHYTGLLKTNVQQTNVIIDKSQLY